MAIIVTENKKGVNIIRLVGWLAVLGIAAGAVYYVFFSAPQLVVISPPESFQNITSIARVTLQPETVLNSAAFQSLKPPPFPLPTPRGPASIGRANPFVAP